MGCEPPTNTAVCVHVGAEAVAEDDDFVRCGGVLGVDVERGVGDAGHSDFGEERDEKSEDEEGHTFGLRIDVKDFV